MKTFRHAGDRGDIIYSLPTVRHLGGGTMLIEAADYTRVKLTPDRWCGIDKILLDQPYIHGVERFEGGAVDINLNDFRALMFKQLRMGVNRDRNLAEWHCTTFRVPTTATDAAWLELEPVKIARIVVARSGGGRDSRHVYHNPLFPWRAVMDHYGTGDVVFLGTNQEHEVFCRAVAPIGHYSTPDLYEAAKVVAGADLFIGNQNCLAAIAEGLKKRIMLEVWPAGPNCLFTRPGVVHGWDHNAEPPDL